MNPINKGALERWLKNNGEWVDELPSGTNVSAQSRKQVGAAALLAAELRLIADLIESPDIPKELKREKFVAAVEAWGRGVDAYMTIPKEGQND